jgi:magnesium chelatase family protein
MSRVLGAALHGVEGVPIEVEVRLSSQLPRVDIVGLPEAAVRESAARVRSAISASGHAFPDRRITVNLAPAGIRKSGAGLDLPIAIGILAAGSAIEPEPLAGLGLVGELALDGRIRPVRGALPLVLALREAGCDRIIAAAGNEEELALAPGAPVLIASDLVEVLGALIAGHDLAAAHRVPECAGRRSSGPDLATVRGQEGPRRALEIAAAGGHGLLMRGAPGSGKTLLARVLPSLLPPLSRTEALEATRIWSAAGALAPTTPFVRSRPFRAPHHSATRAGLLGGGTPPRPGEVSLAHNGVLFLDELPEFERGALEALRQILEDGEIVLARATGRFAFPARFQWVAAANPCPCGWYRSTVRDCRCDEGQIVRYEAKLSGPLLDRVDLHVAVQPVPWRALDAPVAAGGDTSERVRARVEAAYKLQAKRMERLGLAGRTNATLPAEALDAAIQPTPEARRLLGRGVDRLGLSARAAHRTMRVARTIADLAGEEHVEEVQMAEAIGLRG